MLACSCHSLSNLFVKVGLGHQNGLSVGPFGEQHGVAAQNATEPLLCTAPREPAPKDTIATR